MAEITRRRSGELVHGVFKILLPHPDGLLAKTVLEHLVDVVPPTDFENSTYPSRPNVRRFEKIVRFQTINTVKAGWITKEKGQWTLTDEGRSACEQFTDPEQFFREAIRLYRQWKQDQPQDEEADLPDTATTFEEAEEAAWSEIQDYLSDMNP